MATRGPSATSVRSDRSLTDGNAGAAADKTANLLGAGATAAGRGNAAGPASGAGSGGNPDAAPIRHFSSALAAAARTGSHAEVDAPHTAAKPKAGAAPGRDASAIRAGTPSFNSDAAGASQAAASAAAIDADGAAELNVAANNASAVAGTAGNAATTAAVADNAAAASADAPLAASNFTGSGRASAAAPANGRATSASKATGKTGKARSGSDEDISITSTELTALAMLLGAGAAAALGSVPAGGAQTGAAAQAGNPAQGTDTAVGGVDGRSSNPNNSAPGTASNASAAAADIATGTGTNGTSGDAPPRPGSLPSLVDEISTPVADNRVAPASLPQLLQQLTDVSTVTSSTASAIAVPVADPSWPQALAAQVHWLATSQIQSATLRLSPEHLGPLEVHIDLQQSQVNVSFHAAHADTRTALAEAVPRLRELLAASGLSLGQASVQQQPRSGPQSHGASPRAASSAAETVEPVAITATRALGLVDEYA